MPLKDIVDTWNRSWGPFLAWDSNTRMKGTFLSPIQTKLGHLANTDDAWRGAEEVRVGYNQIWFVIDSCGRGPDKLRNNKLRQFSNCSTMIVLKDRCLRPRQVHCKLSVTFCWLIQQYKTVLLTYGCSVRLIIFLTILTFMTLPSGTTFDPHVRKCIVIFQRGFFPSVYLTIKSILLTSFFAPLFKTLMTLPTSAVASDLCSGKCIVTNIIFRFIFEFKI